MTLPRRDFLRTALAVGALGSAPPPFGGWRPWWADPGVAIGPYLQVLGHAQDGGLPQAGCYSDRCNRARSQPVYVSSLALVVPEANAFYLVDATPDLTRQMDLIDEPGFRARSRARRPFDGVFLTHAHMGHYLGLALLGREGLAIEPTACYCSLAMEQMLTENAPWSLLVDEGRLFFPRPTMDTWHSVDGHFDMRMFGVPHRPEFSDTVGYMFRGANRTVLFIPDIDSWELWDRPIEDVVGDIDVALLDGSFYSSSEVPGRALEDIPHPLIPHTMDRLQEVVGADHEVMFIHLNNSNPAMDVGGPEEREIRRRGFGLARQGLRISL